MASKQADTWPERLRIRPNPARHASLLQALEGCKASEVGLLLLEYGELGARFAQGRIFPVSAGVVEAVPPTPGAVPPTSNTSVRVAVLPAEAALDVSRGQPTIDLIEGFDAFNASLESAR